VPEGVHCMKGQNSMSEPQTSDEDQLPVGYIFSPIFTHSIFCWSPVPSWLPTYTVPDTCLSSGPAVVVNRAESAFSGSKDFLRAVRGADEAALSSGSALGSTGTSMPKSAMIWSAVRRRSEDLRGERGLICGTSVICCLCDTRRTYVRFFLKHC
jgi:hypothetical protein